jgi:hypothetical protein
MPKYCSSKLLTNTTFFSDNLGSYIANGQIETNKLTTNGDIILTGSITNGSNSITFTENTLYTNIEENFFIHGTGLIMYNGVNYNIGQILSAFVGGGTIAPYPSITYDSSLNTTTFTGLLLFPATSISSASINNSDFATISTSQTLSNKTFSGTTIFSSIQLNDNLIVNAGGTTILNDNLALINFLSGTSTNINTRFTTNETNISGVQTKTTGLSYNLSQTTTTCTGRFIFNQTPTMAGSLRIDASLLVGTQGNITITNAQLQLIPDIGSLNSKTQYLTFTTNNSTFSQTLNANNFNFTGNINNTFSKIQFDNAINFSKSATSDLQTQINSINTDLDNYALQSALQAILDDKIGTLIYYEPTDFTIVNNFLTNGELQYTPDGSTKINLIPIITSNQNKLTSVSWNSQYQYLDIANNCHIFGKLQLGNYADIEYSLNAVIIAEGVTAGFTATNTTAIAFIVGTTLPAMQLEIDGLGITVGDHSGDISSLQQKTSQISYNSTTDRTTISQILYSPYLEVGNIESGFNQTTNEQVTFTGLLRCNNRVEINNTLELVNNNSIIVEGIINQDNATPPNSGVNQFQAPTNFNGNVIMTNTSTSINATTCQIGTNAVSTLNCNSTASFGGDVTMLTNKNLRLKNIVPILLDDIYFGGEAGVHITDDVIFNMKITANQPLQINNTCQIGTTISRNTLTSYTTTTILDANTGMTLTTPTIGITSPLVSIGQNGVTVITINGSLVQIGQTLGVNTLYGTTYIQNLQSLTGVIGSIGSVMQQF